MLRPTFALLALLAVIIPTTVSAEPAASVGSWKLDVADVDKQITHKIYELREAKVQEMVIDHLLELEAKANGIAVNQVMDEMVNKKIPPLTDADVTAFIEANKGQLPEGGKGMDAKIRSYLQNQLEENLQGMYLRSLTNKYQVAFLLKPPRYTVPGPQDLSKGPATAPITIIEFSDFECPYCRRAQETINKVEKKYGDKVRFVFRHYPLPFHKKAPKASEAAQCAKDQGAFWPFHDALFAKGSKLEISEYKKLAKKLKLNSKQFDHCLDSGSYASRVAADSKDGKSLGITGTPTFFINGIKLVGAVPFTDFTEVINQELAK
ncbi:MAG: DsbA family protein [Magnetococcales bacterium]|nr:DsbA family protein [Magnetococcales bacterium]